MRFVPLFRGWPGARCSRAGSAIVHSSFVLVVSGCAVSGCTATTGGAPYKAALAGDQRFAAPSSPPSEDAAAVKFETGELDRRAYVRAVLARNPTLEAARQGVRAALSRVRETGAFEDPMIDLGVAPLSIGSAKAPLGYEVGISQKLPWFGKRGFEAAAASAEAEATKSDFEAMRRELGLSAVVLYDQYFIAVRSLQINAHHVELMRAMREAANTEYQVGRVTAQDSLQAEAELAHMEHDAAQLTAQRDITIAQMNELLHRAPELPLPPPPAELTVPAIPSAAQTQRLEHDAVAQRSEISAARQRAQGAQARAARAEREYYPDVTLSTTYNSMWDMPEHRWMIGLGFNLPVQSGQRAGSADEARALGAQFESDALRLTDAVKTQVFVALKQLQESEHVMGLFEQRLLPIARQQIEAAQAGFTASQTSFTALVAAEKNLRSVELDYQMARAECDRHRAELDRALGRIPGLGAAGSQP